MSSASRASDGGREADEVGEEDRDQPALGCRRRRRRGRRGRRARREREPHSPQNFIVGRVRRSARGAGDARVRCRIRRRTCGRPRSPCCRWGRRCVITWAVSHADRPRGADGALGSAHEREAPQAGYGCRRRGAQRLRRGAGARSPLVAARAAHPDAPDRGLRRAPGRRRGRRRRPLGADSRDRDRRRDGGNPPRARMGNLV